MKANVYEVDTGNNKTEERKDELEILRVARRRFDMAATAEAKERELAVQDDKFVAGDQWPHNIKNKRKNRPCLTFNKTKVFRNQVINDIRQNRPQITVKPVEGSNIPFKLKSITGNRDYSLAEVYTGLIKNIENQSRAPQAYDKAAENAVTGGWGYFRIITEYVDDSFDQVIKFKRIRNRFTVYHDPMSEELTKEDANFCFITAWIDDTEYKEKYPNGSYAEVDSGLGEDMEKWFNDGKVRIAEYFCKKPKKKRLVRMTDGSIHHIDKENEKILDELEAQGITIENERDVMVDVVMWYKINGNEILEGPIELPTKYIPVVHVMGDEHVLEGEVIREGLIRPGIDAQMAYNFHRTAMIERVALQPKVPYLIGASQVGNYEAMWKNANQNNYSYLIFDDKINPNPPRREMPPLASPGDTNEVMHSNDDIKATIGMFDPSIGKESNEKSGVAINARKRQSDTGSFHFTDNLIYAIEYAGRILVDMIPRVYDGNRVIRIINPDDTEDFVEINKTIVDEQTGEEVLLHDMNAGKFDVVVKAGPSYATQRMESADKMIQFAGIVPQAGQIGSDIIAKNLDFADSDEMAKRLRKTIPEGIIDYGENEERPEPVQPTPEQQATLAKAQADTAMAEAKGMEAEAKKAEAELEMAKLMQEVSTPDQVEGQAQGGFTPEQQAQIEDMIAAAFAQVMRVANE